MINYSQCWEDPELLYRALEVKSDDIVVSITSGGDNCLALLNKQPRQIYCIDSNIEQSHLLELKAAALNGLGHSDFLCFIGINKSERRIELYKKIEELLPLQSKHWWTENVDLIAEGIIHIGRFERFLVLFNSYLLPFVHSRKTIFKFIEINDLEKQKQFFDKTWNSRFWKGLFRLASSRFILKYFARQKGMFQYSDTKSVAEEYENRLNNNLRTIPIDQNYFMHYCLTGNFRTVLPPYLQEENQGVIKQRLYTLKIVTDNLLDFLKKMPNESISKFNLSDIFEPMSDAENSEIWREIFRTAKNHTRIVYWNNLVLRTFPVSLQNHIEENRILSHDLYKQDRNFFYSKFHINTIIK